MIKSDPGPNSGDLAKKYDSNDGWLLCRYESQTVLVSPPRNFETCPAVAHYLFPYEII